MNPDLKNILNHANKDIGNQELLRYLQEQLDATEAHAVEEQMADDAFTNDAVEGLQSIQNKSQLPQLVDQLHNQLQTQISKSRERRNKKWSDSLGLPMTILLVLLLLLIGFIVLLQFLH